VRMLSESTTNVLGFSKKGLGEIEETDRSFRTASYEADDHDRHRSSVGSGSASASSNGHVGKRLVFGTTGA
jgi:hypothetical protein